MAKVRKGFVSNSSSSSFIVAFPKGFVPTTQSVADLLFGGTEGTQCYYDNCADYGVMARVIAGDMQSQKPDDPVAIMKEVKSNIDHDMEDYRNPMGSPQRYDWDALDKAVNEAAAKETTQLMSKWVHNDIYVFEYSDNDGSMKCSMEHGGTFDKIEHIRVSKH